MINVMTELLRPGDSTPALMVLVPDLHLVDPNILQGLFETCRYESRHLFDR
jgi:hypothetical protein